MHRIFVMILCLSIFFTNFNGMVLLAGEAAEPTPGVADRIADDSTMDTYLDALNIAENSMNAGRVWADKSVFTGDVTLDTPTDGIENVTIRNDSDFMHVFSTIGSTLQTVPESIPLDLVFVLDFSASMTTGIGADRMPQTVEAVNNAINTILECTPNSRIGIVVYSSKAKVLVPLAKLVPENVSTKKQWLDCSQISISGTGPVSFNGNGMIAKTESSWSELKDLGETVNVGYDAKEIGYQTNLQSGIALGMSLLAEEKVTKWYSEENGMTVTRIPAVIVMTDGQNNLLCQSTDNNQPNAWWKTNPQSEFNYIDEYNEGVVPLILSTLMTASYNTSRIYDNYYPENGSISAEGKHFYAYGISIDMQQNSEAEQKIHAILDPRTYFNDDEMLHKSFDHYYLTNHYDKDKNENSEDRITEAFKLLDKWNGAGELNVGRLASSFSRDPNGEPYPKDVKLGGVDQTGFSIETLKNNVNFTDEFYDVASDQQNEIFNEIVGNLVKLSLFRPVGGHSGQNDINRTDMLSYVDPIGKYMEVKDVKNVLLFGEIYGVDKSGDPVYYNKEGGNSTQEEIASGNYAYVQQNYRIKFTGDGEVTNLSYGLDHAYTFYLTDIEIYTKTTWDFRDPDIENGNIRADTGSDQSLYINIPAVALPVQRATVTVNQNGVEDYSTNLDDKKFSTPLRVFYTVGVTDDLKNENGAVDLAKISPDYVNEALHSDDDGNIFLYSNWYNPKKDKYEGYANGDAGGYTFGDAVVTFTPSRANRYYLYQEYLPLRKNGNYVYKDYVYNDSDEFEIEIKYFTKDKEFVETTVTRKISEFGKDIGTANPGEYLCWYDPVTKDVIENFKTTPPEGYVLAAKVGGVSIGDLFQSIKSKGSGNNTSTADTYYLPTISDSTSGKDVVINVYCGNNGRLSITDTQLLVTKTVDVIGADAEDIAGEAFEYTVQLNDPQYFGGTYSAIKVTAAGKDNWRALISSIDLLTNNQGLLLNEGGQLATYEDGKYYVYVGGVSEEDHFTHTLFDINYGSLDDVLSGNDSADLTVKEAYLIPVSTYEEAAQNGGWTFSGAGILKKDFVVGNIDTNEKIGYEVNIRDYQSTTVYEYETLAFDSTGTAKFTLKGGEGILLIGIDPKTGYTVTEILSGSQADEKGILFRSLRHRTGENSYTTAYDNDHKENQNGSYYNFIDETEHKYTAYGETDVDYRREEHYCNFLPEAEKELIKPEREFVNVGDVVEYLIYWENYYYEIENDQVVYKPAKVTITDPLDPGVDFVDAEFVELSDETARGEVSYDEATHTVTWTIDEADPEESGYVRLKVKVNNNAAYAYDNTGNVTSRRDNQIKNQAHVTVNDFKVSTEKVKTPVGEVHKTETAVQDSKGKKTKVSVKDKNLVQEKDKNGNPGNFVGPMVGKEFIITYEISFVNYKTEKAKVTVTDKIDPDAVFYSASYEGVTLSADSEPRLDKVEEGNVKISIGTVKENEGTEEEAEFEKVTWEISNVPAGFEGKVTLQVKVSEDAYSFENVPFVPDDDDDDDDNDTGLTYVKLTGKDLENSVLPEGDYLIVYNTTFLGNTLESNDTILSGKSKANILGSNSEENFVMGHDNEIGDYIKIKDPLAEGYPDSITWTVNHASPNEFYLKNKGNGEYLNVEYNNNNYAKCKLNYTKNPNVTWKNAQDSNNKYGKLQSSLNSSFGYYYGDFCAYNTAGLYSSFIYAMDFYKLEEYPEKIEKKGTRVYTEVDDISEYEIIPNGEYIITYNNGQEFALDNGIVNDVIVGKKLDDLKNIRITQNQQGQQEIRIAPEKNNIIKWTIKEGTVYKYSGSQIIGEQKGFLLINNGKNECLSKLLTGTLDFSPEQALFYSVFLNNTNKSGVLTIYDNYANKGGFLGYISNKGCAENNAIASVSPLKFYKLTEITEADRDISAGGNTGGGSTGGGNDQPKFPDLPSYSEGDYKIHNTANVQIDTDEWQKTETMENPMAGELTIGKLVEDPNGDPDTTTPFNFTITMTGPKGFSPNDLDYPDGAVKWTYADGYSDQSDPVAYIGYFSLKSGDEITIKHIPYGIEYDVTEVGADGFDFQFVVVDGKADSDSNGSVTGTLVKTPTKMTYHNAPKGVTVEPPLQLPETGGTGTKPYYLFGFSFIIAGLIWTAIEKKKSRNDDV